MLKETEIAPLIIAIMDGDVSAVSREVQLCNVDQVHRGRRSALKYAIAEQHPKIVALLIEAGADVNRVNLPIAGGDAPLTYAATHGTPEIIRLLLDAGALVDLTYAGRGTALCWAARGAGIETVRMLVEAGADVNAESYEMATPLAAAREMGQGEVVEYLLGLGPELPLGRILRHNRDPFLSDLFAGVATPTVRDSIKHCDRYCSASWGGLSSLGWAAVLRNRKAIRLLVTLGADPDGLDPNCYTPLMRAVACGASDSVRLLLEMGADPRVVGFHGDTALHIAASTRRRNLYNLLIERGADPCLVNASGRYSPEEIWKRKCFWFSNDGWVSK